MIQYVVPPVALRMKPPLKNWPPWPQPTKLSAPGDPVKTPMFMIWLLRLGSNATRSSLAGVNEYQTVWGCPKQDDGSVEESNVASERSTVSWNGRPAMTVALLMLSLDGADADAGAAVATSSGTIAASGYRTRARRFNLTALPPSNRYQITQDTPWFVIRQEPGSSPQ